MTTLEFPTTTKTLRQRLGEGRIPVQEGLQYAALIAEALRKIHDEGRAHGCVTPDSVALTAHGLDLLPAVYGVNLITPYTAPEVAADHKPPEQRSDIFSFGAILFEILTGRKAFGGETEALLIASLCASPAPPTGSPAVDGLLTGCLAKEPSARWQRIQKVQLELKLLSAAARRVAAPIPARTGATEALMRIELAQMETRFNAKLKSQEDAMASVQHSAGESVNSLRDQLTALAAKLATANEQISRWPDVASVIEAAVAGVETRVQHNLDGVHQSVDAVKNYVEDLMTSVDDVKGNVGMVAHGMEGLSQRLTSVEHDASKPSESMNRLEANLQALREQVGELHTHVAADMHEFELNLKAQSHAIDSVRTAMAQTDDLVERVVEALESLQSTVLEQPSVEMHA